MIQRRSKVNDWMIKWIRHEYEIIFEDVSGKMTVSGGKFHKYLGMTLDYTVHGQVQITMINFLEKVLIDFEKAEPKGGTQRQVQNLRISLMSTKIARRSHIIRLCIFTTWWQILCIPPNEPGQTPARLLSF